MGPRRRMLEVAAVVAAATLAVAPAAAVSRAGAQDDAGDGIVALQSEVLALVELKAWPAPVPERLQAVHDEYASFVEGQDRRSLMTWVVSADVDGNRVLERLRDAGERPTPAETAALGTLSDADLQALREGRRLSLLPETYVRALDELDVRAAGGRPGPDDGPAPDSDPAPDEAVTASALPTPDTSASPTPPGGTAPTSLPATAPTPAATPATSTTPGSTGSLVVPVAVGVCVAAGLVVALATAVLRRRRGRPEDLSSGHVVALLNAGRLLSAAGARTDVARVAVEQLVALLGADAGLLVTTDGRPDGRWDVLADPAGVLARPARPAAALARVAATGQARLDVLTGDPDLGGRALLAVPVLGAGEVLAVLAAVRPPGRPFLAHELRPAAELAPLVASALRGAAALEDVRTQAARDALTGLPNRRSLDADLQAEVELRAGRTTAVVMLDVDHFKVFNDREGHAAGDAALRAVAEVLAATVRSQDGAYRYGGEEFCLLVRQVTVDEVVALLDRVLAQVRAVDVPGAAGQPAGHLSVSAGVALVESEDAALAVVRADEALYRAKQEGRDRYALAPPLTGSRSASVAG